MLSRATPSLFFLRSWEIPCNLLVSYLDICIKRRACLSGTAGNTTTPLMNHRKIYYFSECKGGSPIQDIADQIRTSSELKRFSKGRWTLLLTGPERDEGAKVVSLHFRQRPIYSVSRHNWSAPFFLGLATLLELLLTNASLGFVGCA